MPFDTIPTGEATPAEDPIRPNIRAILAVETRLRAFARHQHAQHRTVADLLVVYGAPERSVAQLDGYVRADLDEIAAVVAELGRIRRSLAGVWS